MTFYKKEVFEKFDKALGKVWEELPLAVSHVRISNGNSKMGQVPSVSLLPIYTCPARCKETCATICYAAKIANMRKNVRESYAINTVLADYAKHTFFKEIREFCMGQRFFRWHVSGDFINYDYFVNVVEIAKTAYKCDFMVFTKKWELVNTYVDRGGIIPKNLHILFSGWSDPELKPINPYNFPETQVIKKDMAPNENWKICGGNCYQCGCKGLGCWQAKKGDVIAFYEH